MQGVFWMGVIGLAFLVMDLFYIRKLLDYFHLKKHGIACEATVIATSIRHHKGHASLYPTLEFSTTDGKAVVVTSEFGTSTRSGKYREGEKVQLFYDTDNPKHYIIVPDDLYGRIAVVSLYTFFLVLFAGCSIVFLVDILTR